MYRQKQQSQEKSRSSGSTSFSHLNFAPTSENDSLAKELLYELLNLASLEQNMDSLVLLDEDAEEFYENLSCDDFLIFAMDYEDTSLHPQFSAQFEYLDERPLVETYLTTERVSAQDLRLPDLRPALNLHLETNTFENSLAEGISTLALRIFKKKEQIQPKSESTKFQRDGNKDSSNQKQLQNHLQRLLNFSRLQLEHNIDSDDNNFLKRVFNIKTKQEQTTTEKQLTVQEEILDVALKLEKQLSLDKQKTGNGSREKRLDWSNEQENIAQTRKFMSNLTRLGAKMQLNNPQKQNKQQILPNQRAKKAAQEFEMYDLSQIKDQRNHNPAHAKFSLKEYQELKEELDKPDQYKLAQSKIKPSQQDRDSDVQFQLFTLPVQTRSFFKSDAAKNQSTTNEESRQLQQALLLQLERKIKKNGILQVRAPNNMKLKDIQRSTTFRRSDKLQTVIQRIPFNIHDESLMRLQPEGSDVEVYRVKDERIYHYILKRSSTTSDEFFNVMKLQKLLLDPSGHQPFLATLKQKYMEDCQKLMLLGEPDYIQLYLSFYPIVQKPYLLDSQIDFSVDDSDSNMTMTLVNLSEVKQSSASANKSELSSVSRDDYTTNTLLEDRNGGLYAIPEEDDAVTSNTQHSGGNQVTMKEQSVDQFYFFDNQENDDSNNVDNLNWRRMNCRNSRTSCDQVNKQNHDDYDIISIAASLLTSKNQDEADEIDSATISGLHLLEDEQPARQVRKSMKKFKGIEGHQNQQDHAQKDDGVLSCLQTLQRRKETQANRMLWEAAEEMSMSGSVNHDDFGSTLYAVRQDGCFEPDIPDEVDDQRSREGAALSTSSLMVDSSCDTWINFKKFNTNFNNQQQKQQRGVIDLHNYTNNNPEEILRRLNRQGQGLLNNQQAAAWSDSSNQQQVHTVGGYSTSFDGWNSTALNQQNPRLSKNIINLSLFDLARTSTSIQGSSKRQLPAQGPSQDSAISNLNLDQFRFSGVGSKRPPAKNNKYHHNHF